MIPPPLSAFPSNFTREKRCKKISSTSLPPFSHFRISDTSRGIRHELFAVANSLANKLNNRSINSEPLNFAQLPATIPRRNRCNECPACGGGGSAKLAFQLASPRSFETRRRGPRCCSRTRLSLPSVSCFRLALMPFEEEEGDPPELCHERPTRGREKEREREGFQVVVFRTSSLDEKSKKRILSS